MATFTFDQDILVKIWRRNKVTVEAETKEEAIRIISKYKENDLSWELVDDEDEGKINLEGSEFLLETERDIDKEYNDGNPTMEIMDDEDLNLVAHN